MKRLLTKKENDFLIAYINSNTKREACVKSGVSERQASRYLAKAEFKKELAEYQSDAVRDAVKLMSESLVNVAITLNAVLEAPNTSHQVKINACQALVQSYNTLIENHEIMNKLNELESLLGGEKSA